MEIERRLANALLAEIKRGKPLTEKEIDAQFGCYGKGDLDELTRELCAACKKLGPKIRKMSLELQMWWRDHQAADVQKKADAAKAKKREEDRKAALKKLSPAERKALNLG